MKFKNKNVLITGSNRGIGKAILLEFAKNGANVLAHARKPTPEFGEFIDETSEKYNIKITPIYFDLTDYDAMKSAIKDLIKSKINIDILINNAGIPHGNLFQMTSISTIREVFETNLFAQMEITQIILKIMARNKQGSIVNIASTYGLDPSKGNSAYGTSKSALILWTMILAAECAPYGIRVNAIAPGLTDTTIVNCMEEKAKNEVLQNSTMKRLGKPEEIAQTVLFLASDEASFVNGQIIRVDGGKA